MNNEEEKAEYYIWKERFNFIIDITAKTDINEWGDKYEDENNT